MVIPSPSAYPASVELLTKTARPCHGIDLVIRA